MFFLLRVLEAQRGWHTLKQPYFHSSIHSVPSSHPAKKKQNTGGK